MSFTGWNKARPRKLRDSRYLSPDLARDELGDSCRKCHEDQGQCICAAFCGVMVCKGPKEEKPDE